MSRDLNSSVISLNQSLPPPLSFLLPILLPALSFPLPCLLSSLPQQRCLWHGQLKSTGIQHCLQMLTPHRLGVDLLSVLFTSLTPVATTLLDTEQVLDKYVSKELINQLVNQVHKNEERVPGRLRPSQDEEKHSKTMLRADWYNRNVSGLGVKEINHLLILTMKKSLNTLSLSLLTY